MKRFALVSGIMFCIVCICIYSMYYVKQAKDRVDNYTDAISAAIESENSGMIREDVERLTKYWTEKSPALARFVRHAHVDEISRAVAKIGSYAEYEKYAELSAELGVIACMIESIWQSELPRLGNIM